MTDPSIATFLAALKPEVAAMSGYWFEVTLGVIVLLALFLSVPAVDGLLSLLDYLRIFKAQEKRLR